MCIHPSQTASNQWFGFIESWYEDIQTARGRYAGLISVSYYCIVSFKLSNKEQHMVKSFEIQEHMQEYETRKRISNLYRVEFLTFHSQATLLPSNPYSSSINPTYYLNNLLSPEILLLRIISVLAFFGVFSRGYCFGPGIAIFIHLRHENSNGNSRNEK